MRNEIHKPKTQTIGLTIKDEYTMDELCGYIEKTHMKMRKAEYGG